MLFLFSRLVIGCRSRLLAIFVHHRETAWLFHWRYGGGSRGHPFPCWASAFRSVLPREARFRLHLTGEATSLIDSAPYVLPVVQSCTVGDARSTSYGENFYSLSKEMPGNHGFRKYSATSRINAALLI